MDTLSFTKMHGAGNDFVIIDNRSQQLQKDRIIELAPTLCNRRFGIGADGIIALQPAELPDTDYAMFYRNADGSDAGMCGNGARCLALYAESLGLGDELRFSVHQQIYSATVDASHGYVTLTFPMSISVDIIEFEEYGQVYQMYAGTEHVVIEIPENEFRDDEKLRAQGKKLRHHPRFNPPGTNVNFIVGESPEAINIKTFEKGVENLTLACGTGAIASAIAWDAIHNSGHRKNGIKVEAEGGTLQVGFSRDSDQTYSNITLGGEAQFVFEGTYGI